MTRTDSPFLVALRSHSVSAKIVDIDHYRVRGGKCVETDYIVEVSPRLSSQQPLQQSPQLIQGPTQQQSPPLPQPPSEQQQQQQQQQQPLFATFRLAKTYAAFRTWAEQLKAASHAYTSNAKTAASLPQQALAVANYCELVFHLMQSSQKTQYLGQVNFRYVQVLALQRKQLIERVLEATTMWFPPSKHPEEEHPLVETVANLIETFLLTDHCNLPLPPPVQEDSPHVEKDNNHPLAWLPFMDSLGDNNNRNNAKKKKRDKEGSLAPIVIPLTRRDRRSILTRTLDEKDFLAMGDEAKLLLDDDRSPVEWVPSYTRPVPVIRSGGTRIGTVVDNNPFIFVLIFLVAVGLLQRAALVVVRLDGDLALLVIFAAFCLGLHTPRPMVGGFDRPPSMKGTIREVDPSGRDLLRRSMETSAKQMSSVSGSVTGSRVVDGQKIGDESVERTHHTTPMSMFPEGASLGSVTNCWGLSEPSDFQVRGPNYLQDRKKVPSDDFIFPIRGVDFFLTDTCPENVGSHASMLGGDLRRLPTFIVNFRLPWGVLVLYYEIPEMYIPFILACYEPDFDQSKLPSLESMCPGERATCRFLQKDQAAKNKLLKIVPVVVKGPWIVRQVVGGKPAIIGNKLHINYVYEPANDTQAMYLEADLDIAASSAARGILSVARTYTNVLTLDLGFVVQSNELDELPERMPVGCRLHGVDPLQAMPFPTTTDQVLVEDTAGQSSDDDSLTPITSSAE